MELERKNFHRTDSLCSPDPHSQLLKAFQNKDFDTFQNILKSGVDPNHFYDDPHYATLLDLACQSKNSSQYVKTLLDAGADPNKVNPVRKKAPLHFAVENKDLSSVNLLLNDSRINTNVLDNFGNTPLHLAAKINNTELLDRLLKHPEMNVNLTNRKGQTAVYISVLQKNKKAIELLIRKENIELDNFSDGKSTRELILENFNELTLPCPSERKENGIATSGNLFSLLYEMNKYNSSESELYNTLSESFLEEIRNKNKDFLDSNDGFYTFLQYTCEFGLAREVDALLREGADPNRIHPSNKSTPIMLACKKGYHKIVKLLINNDKTNYQPVEGETVLHATVKGSAEPLTSSDACKDDIDYFKCLKLLLQNEKIKKFINRGDVKGNTALHYAANQGNPDVILTLLRQGAYVGICNTFGEPAFADINPRIMEMYLDECLTTNDKLPREDNYEIIFHYSFLQPPKFLSKSLNSSQVTLQSDANTTEIELGEDTIISETDPLLYMCQSSELRPLLKHPVLTSFLHLKWHLIRCMFYVNLIFYILFLATLTGYILDIYGATNSTDSNPKNVSQAEQETLPFQMVESSSYFKKLITYFILPATVILLIFRELFQIIISPLRYLKSPENWLEIGIISVTIAILFCNVCVKARHQISAIAILLSWAELVLLIGRHPSLSTNIEMFKTVSWSFLKFIAWYSSLIIAFALSFYILFRDSQDVEGNFFLDPLIAIFKTVVMLTGEFDASSIPFVEHPGVSHILFVLFVFLIAIVLFNLLNGLAVSDTQAIRADAELLGYVSRVKFVSYVETMAFGDPTPCKPFEKLRSLCCCIPEIDCFSTQFKWLRIFSRKTSLFEHLPADCTVRVLPNQRNKVETVTEKHRRKRQELDDIDSMDCRNNCAICVDSYMGTNIVKTAKGVLAKKAEEKQMEIMAKKAEEERNKVHENRDKLLLEYKEMLDSMRESVEKTQKMLEQFLLGSNPPNFRQTFIPK